MPGGSARNIIEIVIKGENLTDEEFAAVNANLKTMASNLQKAGAVSMGVGLAMTAGLGALVMQAADLEAGVTNALSLVDVQGEAFRRMASNMMDLATELSRKLGIAGSEVTTSFYQVLSSGAEAMTENFARMTETSLRLAKTVGLDTSASVEMLSDTINAFGGSLADAERYADVFFNTSKLTATTVPQLAEAMRQAGPIAASLKIPLESTATILAAFAAKGTKGAEAGTAFRMVIARLAAPTGNAAKELERLGIKVYDAEGNLRNMLDILGELKYKLADVSAEEKSMTLKTIAGQLAFAKLATLLDSDIDKLKDWEAELNRGGALQRGYENKMAGFRGQWELLREELKATALTLGRELLPNVTEIITRLRGSARAVGDFVAANSEAVFGLASFALALTGSGGVLVGLGTMIKLLGTVSSLAASVFSPAGLIIAGVVAASAVFVKLQRNIADTRRALEEIASESYSIKIEPIELSVKGVKYAIEREAGEALIASLEEWISRLEALFPESMIKVPIGGRVEEMQVAELIAALKKRIEDTRARMRIEAPPEQEIVDQIQGAIDAARRWADEAKIEVKVEGKTVRMDKEAYIKFLEEQKRLIESGASFDALREKVERVDLAAEMTAEEFRDLMEEISALAEIAAPRIAPETKIIPDEVWMSEKERAEKEARELGDIVRGEIEGPELTAAFTDEEIARIRSQTSAIANILASGFNTAFQKIIDTKGKLVEGLLAGFQAILKSFLSMVSQMIARWLAFKFVTRVLGLSMPGISLFGMQAGGTIVGGTRGKDTIVAALGRRETVLSDELTDKLDGFLEAVKEAGLGSAMGPPSLSISLRPQLLTATEQEAVRFARVVGQKMAAMDAFIVRGGF